MRKAERVLCHERRESSGCVSRVLGLKENLGSKTWASTAMIIFYGVREDHIDDRSIFSPNKLTLEMSSGRYYCFDQSVTCGFVHHPL